MSWGRLSKSQPSARGLGAGWAVSCLVVGSTLLGALAGCGGSADDGASPSAQGAASEASSREHKAGVHGNTPQTGGAWASPFDMKLVAIHMTLLPDGRVMYFGSDTTGTDQSAFASYALWNPGAAAPAAGVEVLPNTSGQDMFCSTSTLLVDGRVLVAGGDVPNTGGFNNIANNQSLTFDPISRTLTRRNDLNRARWYGSAVTLMNGEVMLQGGAGGGDFPEVRQADGSYRLLTTASTVSMPDLTYPRNWIAPDGQVFGIAGMRTYRLNPAGTGQFTPGPDLPAALGSVSGVANAMFRPGHLFSMGYSGASATLDIRGSTPGVEMAEAVPGFHSWSVATVLADGRVLRTGGSQFDDLATAQRRADVWNPITREWTFGPQHQHARLYHGTALLLPDARVLLAGGGLPGPVTNQNGEIYSPSYLFNAHGQPAVRPQLLHAPTVVNHAQVFGVHANSAVSRVTLVRTGSVTHSWNADQRFLDLPFTADATGTQLQVTLPSRPSDTPPGFYMLFVFDAAGVPSVSRILRVNVEGTALPPDAPTVAALADRTSPTALPVRLALAGHSPKGAALKYSAAGLPAGLRLDAATGVISGIPAKAGRYYVTVSAHDGAWSGAQSFIWHIEASPFTVGEAVSPGQGVVGQNFHFAAQANGTGLSYSWNFGDGSPATAWSTSPLATWRYARPGTYTVTVTVKSSDGLPRSSSFLQSVGLPVVGASAQSSQLAVSGTGANRRVWMVNPDANTVAVFDPHTRVRLAEVPVGDGPASVAVAGNGQVWVSNRRGDSLSVIDSQSRAVLATVALPPGSAPYGVVSDAPRNRLYVALEGSGRLLRVDAATRTVTANVAAGPNVRHVAVNHDGQRVFVSRFITPPLPGESTARVEPNAGGVARGGELLVFDGSLRLARTVVLAHSERADAENQGRGIPNYLGALAISPDGSQGYLPAKQDNVMRGMQRDRRQLDFQNTVRAISARINMGSLTEDLAARVDHDNASLASAATFDPSGVFLFVALETSREVAVMDAHQRRQLLRVETGFAPQAVAVSPEGDQLFVANFMSRSLSVHDIAPLRRYGLAGVPRLAELPSVAAEPLSPAVLKGKQLFYDARDTRLARDRYMSCASCHSDGGHDGRTWDFTGFGEGLRNTPTLQGKAGLAHGRLHWSGNFDEVQDFENQIRQFAGGTGLIEHGAPNPPMGAPNAGRSSDLDALAAYVGSLSRLVAKPPVGPAGMNADARAGSLLYAAQCAQCHGGASGGAHTGTQLMNVGTLGAGSGQRLGAPLTGIDVPPLQGVAHTAPYLHDGSAATLDQAIARHNPKLDAAQLRQLAAYLVQADPQGDAAQVRPATELAQAPDVHLAGVALQQGPGQFRLVPAEQSQAGAVWATQRWSTTQPFQTRLRLQMERAAGQSWQADGLAFVLQSGEGGLGGAGGGQGWAGLPKALAAQLLTWNYNRAGWTWEGRQAPAAGVGLGQAARVTGEMTVTWDPGLQQLFMDAELMVDGQKHSVRDVVSIDLAARYGPTVKAGITAATGGGVSSQWVSGWTTRFGLDAVGAGGRVTGDALALPGGAVQLTPDRTGTAGGWAAARRWPTDQAFDTRFALDVHNPQGGLMADGLGLVLHGGTPDQLGGAGGCQGSCDLPGAVRAMLLSWLYNQGGLTAEGVPLKPLAFNLGAATRLTGTLSVRWEPSINRLSMRADVLADGVAHRVEDAMTIDLRKRFGPTMSVAITAATGGAKASHRVSAWTVNRLEGAAAPVGGIGVGAPACVVSDAASGRLDCVIVGTDQALYHQALAGQRWTGWTRLGGQFVSQEAPSCTSWGSGRVDCFLRGTDGQMWQAWGANGKLVLNALGGSINAAVSCTAPEANRLHCMVRGSDGAAWVKRWNGGPWSDWTYHAGGLTSVPSCASWGPGRVDCFVLGGASDLWHQWHLMDGRSAGWTPLGGSIKGQPSCVSSGSDRLTCYVRGSDDALWQRGWEGYAWSPWLQVPGTAGRLAAAPTCVAARDKAWSQCSYVSTEGGLWSVSANAESLGRAVALNSQRIALEGVAAEPPACVLNGPAASRRMDCMYRLARDGAPVHSQWRVQ